MFDTSCDAITKKHLSKSQHHTPNFLSNGLSKDFAKRGVFLGIRKNLLFMREREGKTL